MEGEAQGDTQIPSLLNMQQYVYLLLFEYNALRYRIPTSLRTDAYFMLSVMKELYPDVLNLPFYTRCAWHILDTQKLRLIIKRDEDFIMQKSIIRFLQAILPKNIKKLIRPIKRKILSVVKHEYIKPVLNVDVKSNGDITIDQQRDSDGFYRYELVWRALHRLGFEK